jgi:glycosyltransferase involved in cell wall biosynthesis
MDWTTQCAGVIPCLNEAVAIGPLVGAVRRHLPTVIVVDDGSADQTGELAAQAGATLIRHDRPQGKGAALRDGLRAARELGVPWALMLDGDGQHSPDDIPAFLARAERGDAALIVGNRMADVSAMPRVRRWTNRWMSRRISRLAGRVLPDTQCGFRLVRLDAWSALRVRTGHFEFDSELLLAFARAGHGIAFVPVRTIYRDERSKIRPGPDALRWLRWWFRQRRLPAG